MDRLQAIRESAEKLKAGKAKAKNDRFWSKVDRPEKGCWNWTASTNRKYGQFWDGKRMALAHRYSYELEYGPIPCGYVCCHRCDNPTCVRPTHLWIGTQRENMLDRHRKGRTSPLAKWPPKC